jgi:PHD/YefM family antitoxin component YafN of YafNO toxin-antitoxin module
MSDVGIGEAGARLEMLVQQCAAGRERVVITGRRRRAGGRADQR